MRKIVSEGKPRELFFASPVVHPTVHLFGGTPRAYSNCPDRFTSFEPLRRHQQTPADTPHRSLKVATRVRIPLGLRADLDPLRRSRLYGV
jgi:hypothetical protein